MHYDCVKPQKVVKQRIRNPIGSHPSKLLHKRQKLQSWEHWKNSIIQFPQLFCWTTRQKGSWWLVSSLYLSLILISDSPQVSLRLGRTLDADNIRTGHDVYFECDVKANPSPLRLEWLHNVNTEKILPKSTVTQIWTGKWQIDFLELEHCTLFPNLNNPLISSQNLT